MQKGGKVAKLMSTHSRTPHTHTPTHKPLQILTTNVGTLRGENVVGYTDYSVALDCIQCELLHPTTTTVFEPSSRFAPMRIFHAVSN